MTTATSVFVAREGRTTLSAVCKLQSKSQPSTNIESLNEAHFIVKLVAIIIMIISASYCLNLLLTFAFY